MEFLDLKDNKSFRENELESALLEKIQEFLLELGRSFAFVSRQKRIKTQTSDFYIDLVFYNFKVNHKPILNEIPFNILIQFLLNTHFLR